MNENKIIYNAKTGHSHDGINSARIETAPESIELAHLSSDLLDYLQTFSGTTTEVTGGSSSVISVDDLSYTTEDVSPGDSVFGEIDWVGAALVSQTRIVHSTPTKCDIVFFHGPDFLNDEREFKAIDCTDKFMWEGVWAHTDETGGNKIYFKITNTGEVESNFTIQLKSATMVVNGEASSGSGVDISDITMEHIQQLVITTAVTWSIAKQTDESGVIALFEEFGLPTSLDAGTLDWQFIDLFNLVRCMAYVAEYAALRKTVEIYTPDTQGPISLDSSGEGSFTATVENTGYTKMGTIVLLGVEVLDTSPSADHVFLTVDPGRVYGAPLLEGKGIIQIPFANNGSGSLGVSVKCPGATSGSFIVDVTTVKDSFLEFVLP